MLRELHNQLLRILEILRDFHFGIIFEIVANVLVLCVICKILNIIEKSISDKITANDKNNQIVKIFAVINRIIKFTLFFIMFAGFLQTHGYSVSSLIAGFGITGLAVGFAANSAIANIFGTISIIADKSFKTF